MDKTWELDDANTVKAHFGGFGKKIVTVNGNEVHNSRSMLSAKRPIVFSLPDGRGAAISARPHFMGAPSIDLRLDGRLMVETRKAPIKCAACDTLAKPYDRFCGKCGKPMPSAEDYELRRHIKSATGAIKWLAVFFVLGGLVFFAATKNQKADSIKNPAQMFPGKNWS